MGLPGYTRIKIQERVFFRKLNKRIGDKVFCKSCRDSEQSRIPTYEFECYETFNNIWRKIKGLGRF